MILFWRLRVPLLRSALIAVLATAFIQVSFVNVLRVPAPGRSARPPAVVTPWSCCSPRPGFCSTPM